MAIYVVVVARILRHMVLAKRAQQGGHVELGALYLLVLQVELVPLVARVKVVSVYNMVASASFGLKHLVRLVIISL